MVKLKWQHGVKLAHYALSRGAKPGTREQRSQSARTVLDPGEERLQKTEQSDDRLVLLANP